LFFLALIHNIKGNFHDNFRENEQLTTSTGAAEEGTPLYVDLAEADVAATTQTEKIRR
jgi:hypothetical protein